MKKIIEKTLSFPCYNCSQDKKKQVDCPKCNGTGIYKETFYYFIDGKKKIAFSGDTLK